MTEPSHLISFYFSFPLKDWIESGPEPINLPKPKSGETIPVWTSPEAPRNTTKFNSDKVLVVAEMIADETYYTANHPFALTSETWKEANAHLVGPLFAYQTLWHPVCQAELDLIAQTHYTALPPRLEFQPIFYPVLNPEYACQIARDWNTQDEASGYIGHVLEFDVDYDYLKRYEPKTVGGTSHQELWIPAEDLLEFNRHILPPIRHTVTFRGQNP